jgi:hypothetical protein
MTLMRETTDARLCHAWCLAISVARPINSFGVHETMADVMLVRGVPESIRSVYWWFRFVRLLLFRTIHDVVLMIDRERSGRTAQPRKRKPLSNVTGQVRRRAKCPSTLYDATECNAANSLHIIGTISIIEREADNEKSPQSDRLIANEAAGSVAASARRRMAPRALMFNLTFSRSKSFT